MPLTISDDVLASAGLTEREALIEFACRLFDADKLPSPTAARLAGLTRTDFESELIARGLPTVRYTEEMWEQDKKSLGLAGE